MAKNNNMDKYNNDRKNNCDSKHSKDKLSKEEELDLTNVAELTFDDMRLSDLDLLDTSFLDDSTNKKKKDKMMKEAIKEDPVKKRKSGGNKGIFILLLLLVILVSVFIFLEFNFDQLFEPRTKVKTVTKEVTKTIVDDNYLFLGDSITDSYDLEKYYEDLPTVNSGSADDTSEDILKKLDKVVYQYNPSDVFIHIGENDLVSNIDKSDTISNIASIIDGIKENRPYCNIYLEAIYPINDSDDEIVDTSVLKNRSNEDIRDINEELKVLAKEKNVTYIDMYSLLQDEDGNIKLDYTKDGFHLSSEGYDVVTENLMKYIK